MTGEIIEISERYRVPTALLFKKSNNTKVKQAKEEAYIVLIDQYDMIPNKAARLLRTSTTAMGPIKILRMKQKTQNKECKQ